MGKNIDLKELFPILAIENNYIVSVYGDLTYAVKLTMPLTYSLDESEMDEIYNIWLSVIKTLPENYLIHKQDQFRYINYHSKVDETDSLLELSSKSVYNGRKYLDQSTYLFITKSTENRINKSSSKSSLIENLTINVNVSRKEMQEFEDVSKRIKQIINSSRLISCEDIKDIDLIGTNNNFGIIEKYINLEFNSDITNDIQYEDMELKIGDKYLGALGITSTDNLPSEIDNWLEKKAYSTEVTQIITSFMQPITTGLNMDHIVNQYLFIPTQENILKQLTSDTKKLISLSKISKDNQVNAAANVEFLEDVARSQERVVYSAINILFWGSTVQEKNDKKNLIAAIFSQEMNGIIPKSIQVNLFQIFWSGIAGNSADYPSEERFILLEGQFPVFLSNESVYSPLDITDKVNKGVIVSLSDRLCGVPIPLGFADTEKVDNYNKLILGGSGGGKSFFTNHAIRNYYEQSAHVMIIDVGDSYQSLTGVINETSKGKDGLYYSYTEDNPLSINPFQTVDNYTMDAQTNSFLIALLFTLLKKEDEKITQAEQTHLDTSLNLYLKYSKENNLKLTFNKYYEFLRDVFSKHIKNKNISIENFDFENVLQILEPYYLGGNYQFLFNPIKEDNLLDNRFIVFEIKNIADHPILYRVVTLIIINIFMKKMTYYPRSITKALLIEEAWKVLASENTSSFVKELYKTARKYSAEIWTITQNISDIVSNEIVKDSMTKNSDYKILLDIRKEKYNINTFQQAFGLDKKAINSILSLNLNNRPNKTYKEVAICIMGKVNESIVYGVEVNPFEYACYTSTGKEFELIKNLKKEKGSTIKALSEFIKTKN